MKTFNSLRFIAGFGAAMLAAYLILMYLTPSGAEIEQNTPDGVVRSSFVLIYILGIMNGCGYGIWYLTVRIFGSLTGGVLFGAMLYLSLHVMMFFTNFGTEGSGLAYAISMIGGFILGLTLQQVTLRKLV